MLYCLVGSLLALAIYILYAISRPPPVPTPYTAIPTDSIVLAPAFLHCGEHEGVFLPGAANQQIADALRACAHAIQSKNSGDVAFVVLTQKAVADALKPGLQDGDVIDGMQVFQMHRHDPAINVRTFAALHAALARMTNHPPTQIVLLAHPKHLKRAAMDLKALYSGQIMLWHVGQVLYPEGVTPFDWAKKNILGWIGDCLLIVSRQSPSCGRILQPLLTSFDITAECPPSEQLSVI